MKRRLAGILIVFACVLALFHGFAASAAERKYPESVYSLPPITVIRGDETVEIKLCDTFDFHGNACPGATMAFQAIRYGIKLLHAEGEIPRTDDLLIIARAPGGPMDLLDLIMKGADRNTRTWPPAGMAKGAENFVFDFFRKSTMQAVSVRLLDGLWPADWFELRDKKDAGTITEAESERMQRNRQSVVREFPRKTFVELFGEPQAYTYVAWGSVEKGEMDGLIREQRRRSKEEARKE